MGRLLPLRGEPDSSPGEPRVLDLDDEATGEALSALSSETAREILQLLYERPRTPPEVREEVGTSLQNVHYHLERLEDADLVEPAGTGYSEKGNEMTVYGPASQAVVLFAGEHRHRSRLRDALKRLVGALAVLAGGSAIVQYLLDRFGGDPGTATYSARSGDDGEAAGTATPQATEVGADSAAAKAGNASLDAAEPLATTSGQAAAQPPLDPAVAFFLGGAFMLAVVAAWYYWRVR